MVAEARKHKKHCIAVLFVFDDICRLDQFPSLLDLKKKKHHFCGAF
jgi:hypothetical protein